MSIGKNLKSIRTAKKLSQSDLAEKVNVSRPMIAQIERGTKSLSIPLGKEIAKVLNCTLEDLAE